MLTILFLLVEQSVHAGRHRGIAVVILLLGLYVFTGKSVPCWSVAACYWLGNSDKVRPLHRQLCIFVHVVCQASTRLGGQTDIFLGLWLMPVRVLTLHSAFNSMMLVWKKLLFYPQPPYCLLIVTTGNGLKKWYPLRPIISRITTAIRSRTSTST